MAPTVEPTVEQMVVQTPVRDLPMAARTPMVTTVVRMAAPTVVRVRARPMAARTPEATTAGLTVEPMVAPATKARDATRVTS